MENHPPFLFFVKKNIFNNFKNINCQKLEKLISYTLRKKINRKGYENGSTRKNYEFVG